jgi:hypothetical protein
VDQAAAAVLVLPERLVQAGQTFPTKATTVGMVLLTSAKRAAAAAAPVLLVQMLLQTYPATAALVLHHQ